MSHEFHCTFEKKKNKFLFYDANIT